MKEFRGNSFLKTIKPKNYTFQPGDVIKYAVMHNEYSKDYLYFNEITIENETESIDINIEPSETSKFPVGNLLFEIELTYGDGVVKTYQYDLEIKADGIYERN